MFIWSFLFISLFWIGNFRPSMEYTSRMPRQETFFLKKTISLIIQPTWLPWRWQSFYYFFIPISFTVEGLLKRCNNWLPIYAECHRICWRYLHYSTPGLTSTYGSSRHASKMPLLRWKHSVMWQQRAFCHPSTVGL